MLALAGFRRFFYRGDRCFCLVHFFKL
jgi:hypothetical protein